MLVEKSEHQSSYEQQCLFRNLKKWYIGGFKRWNSCLLVVKGFNKLNSIENMQLNTFCLNNTTQFI